MRNAGELGGRRFQLRWLFSSPLASCACLAGIAGALSLGRAVDALEEARDIRSELEQAAVAIAAEQAAAAFVSSGGVAARQEFDLGKGIAVSTQVEGTGGDGMARVHVSLGEQRYVYRFPVLDGGVPRVFGQPLTALQGGPLLPAAWEEPDRVEEEAWPRLVLAGAREVSDTNVALGLSRDRGVALLRLRVGTDREDFLLGAGTAELRIAPPSSCVAVIHGNLWVDAGQRPLVIDLARSLTLVVEGNAYLGRSIEVRGGGSLTIVTRTGEGVAFADRDGNGRWSAGDELRGAPEFRGATEGVGNVYVGLPGNAAERVELDLGVVVAGELHVAAERAVVHGPLVLAHGGQILPGTPGVLVATGQALPDLQRSALPGFLPVGQPRPGRLELDRHQTLYQASPSR